MSTTDVTYNAAIRLRGWGRASLLPVLLAYAGMNTGSAEPVKVRYTEGVVHGFLALQTMEGQTIADGELSQVAEGDRVTTHLTFRFRDGSLHDETTIFSQRGAFRLLSDHLIQKGPSFKQPVDTTVETSTGQVTVRYTDKGGKEKVETKQMQLPPDVANGLIFTLVKDVDPKAPQVNVSMVAATPKPRLVRILISPQGEDPFSVGSLQKNATHYVAHIEIGGIAGAIAPIIGKQPPDIHIWVLGGTAPSFIKSEGPLYEGGPIWRIQLANPPVFKASPAPAAKPKKG